MVKKCNHSIGIFSGICSKCGKQCFNPNKEEKQRFEKVINEIETKESED